MITILWILFLSFVAWYFLKFCFYLIKIAAFITVFLVIIITSSLFWLIETIEKKIWTKKQ